MQFITLKANFSNKYNENANLCPFNNNVNNDKQACFGSIQPLSAVNIVQNTNSPQHLDQTLQLQNQGQAPPVYMLNPVKSKFITSPT